MLLSSLIGADATAPAGAASLQVSGLTSDSRKRASGLCLRGHRRRQGRRRALHRRLPCPRGPSPSLLGPTAEVAGAGDVIVVRAPSPAARWR